MTGRSPEHCLLTTILVGALLPPDEPEGHMLRSCWTRGRASATSSMR
jgi:hypothetical protein